MPIRQSIWKVGDTPQPLAAARLASEQQLEDIIVANPELLSDELMLIGRQENTGRGGRIDLLAISPDGSLTLVELKRDRSPREVVAQALDYASWVENLEADEIAAIYARFKPAGNLAADFRERFNADLDEEALNSSHQVIVVAATLDDSTERIVGYLGRRGVSCGLVSLMNVSCQASLPSGTSRVVSAADSWQYTWCSASHSCCLKSLSALA